MIEVHYYSATKQWKFFTAGSRARALRISRQLLVKGFAVRWVKRESDIQTVPS